MSRLHSTILPNEPVLYEFEKPVEHWLLTMPDMRIRAYGGYGNDDDGVVYASPEEQQAYSARWKGYHVPLGFEETQEGVYHNFNTGETLINYPGITVTGEASKRKTPSYYDVNHDYASSYNPNGLMEFADTAIGMPMGLLSPTHVGRSIYNMASGDGYGNFWQDVFMHNNGLFSDEFAREHPYVAAIGNLVGDVATLGTGSALLRMPKYRAALQAENAAAQEAVADNWRGMVTGGREVVKQDGTITDNLLRWLGKNEGYKPSVSVLDSNGAKLSAPEEALMRIFEENGVDLSRLSKEDLAQALKLREGEVAASAPSRYTLAKRVEAGDTPHYVLHDYSNGNKVGNTSVMIGEDGNAHITQTRNLTRGEDNPIKGVYERGLNASISIGRHHGGEGVVSGKMLASAPKQYHVLQKFKDRVNLGNTGRHVNYMMFPPGSLPGKEVSSLLEMRRAGSAFPAYGSDMPTWLLKKPTSDIPMKSNLFDPSIIDSFGRMHIDWMNRDMLKGMAAPFGVGSSVWGISNIE